MRVRVNTTQGVVTEQAGNELLIESPARFVEAIALSGQTITANAGNVTSNRVIVNSQGNCVLSLPDADEYDLREIKIKKVNTSNKALTIVPVTGQNIDGEDFLYVDVQYTCITLYAYGGDWHIM